MSALSSTPQAPPGDEHELVAAVRRGDDGAFGELYSRYGGRINSYVFGMVRDHGRAEDIAQEVFISALRRIRQTERPILFKPWIYEIARNACIDEFRRTNRAQEVPLAVDDGTESVDRRLASRAQSPDAALEQRQQLDDLRGAFRGLSESHHRVIVMRELEGLSYTEIGKRLGMTRPVVESTLFRARRRLSEEYQEIATGHRCEQVHTLIERGPKAVQSFGIRERRRLARHVAHCQPCRRYAHAAGLDDSILQTPSVLGKIAALLPIPAFLRWRRPGGGERTGAGSGSHSISALQSAQAVTQYIDAGSSAIGLGRAAAAVAAAVIAGGAVVAGLSSHFGGSSGHAKPRMVVHAGSASAPSVRASEPGLWPILASPNTTRTRLAASKANGSGRARAASRNAHRSPATGSRGSTTTSTGGSTAANGSTSSAGSRSKELPIQGGAVTPSQGLSGLTSGISAPSVHLPSLPGLSKLKLPGLPPINLSNLPTSGLLNVPPATSQLPGGLNGTSTKP